MSATPSPRSRKGLLIALVLVLVIAVGGVLWYRRKHTVRSEPVTTERAVVRTIVQTVTATGKIQPEIEVKISPEVYGEILSLPFREGSRVKKGDLIVRIKADLYQAQVDQQTAAVAAARSSAVNFEAKVEKAQADLKQYGDLFHRKLVSEFEFQSYKTNADVARAELVSAQANVQQAEGLLRQARDALSKTVIYAPMDGTVSSRTSEVGERVVATGSFAGTEIMRIADLGNMEAQVKVNENDLPHVKVGDHAIISIDAYPDRKLNGVVKQIASSALNAGATSSGSATQASGTTTDEVTDFLVKIRVSDLAVQLRPGMSATADIETQTVTDAVAVPIQSVTVRAKGGLSAAALQEKQAKDALAKSGNALSVEAERAAARRQREQLERVVFIKTGDRVRLQAVDTGIADNAWIEIKHGVAPGDEVVAGSYAAISRRLKDGALVRIEPVKKSEGKE